MKRRPSIGLAMLLSLATLAPVVAAEPKVDDAELRRWVDKLDDDRFEVRQQASAQLRQAGKRAVPALESAAGRNSLEVQQRVFQLLKDLSGGAELGAANAAQDALGRLARSKDKDVAARAAEILAERQWKIVAVYEKAGATVSAVDGKILSMSFDSARIEGLDFRPLRHLPDLAELSLSNEKVDDRVLEQLRGLPKLWYLNLYQSRIGDGGLKYLKDLPSLRFVPMGKTRVTDAGLVHLKGLTQLQYVGLRGNNITDAGLVHLKDLTNLTGLYLGETKVTDAGLVHLKGMTQMNYLRLHNVEVSDAGLKHLHGLKQMRRLDAWGTQVTKEGASELREAIPDLIIRALP